VFGDVQAIFGHNLREYRLSRGWSRKELGEVMGGYSEAYIGAIERGDRNLRAQTMDMLGELAGADPSLLFRPPPDWDELRAARSGGDPGRRATKATKAAARRPRPRPEPD
jgi:transcriptional regulator with XRE-family HTH domain